MTDPSYLFRNRRGGSQVEYCAAVDALVWRDRDERETSLRYSDIRKIRVYRSSGDPAYFACVVLPKSGPPIAISNRHFDAQGSLEDRGGAFRSFERGLLARAAKANPKIAFVRGGAVTRLLFAILLGAVAVFAAAVLVATASGFYAGTVSVEESGMTFAIGLLVILLAIPGVGLLRQGWKTTLDPFAPDD